MKIFKEISIFIVSISVCICLAEIMARYANPGYRFYQRTYPNEFLSKKQLRWRINGDLGWVIREKFESHGINYNINKQGFRDQKDFENCDFTKKRIMILGDSFVFGVDENEEYTISSLVQHRLNNVYDVFNLGMPAYGIDQMYLAYKKYAPIIKPDIVIIIFIADDVRRTGESYSPHVNLEKPSFYIKQGKLFTRTEKDLNFFDYLSQKSIILNMLYNAIYRLNLAHNISEKIFSEIIHETRVRKEKLLVIKYPQIEELRKEKGLKKTVRKKLFGFDDFFKKNSITYLDPTLAMLKLNRDAYERLFLSNMSGAHPSGEGNKFVTDYMFKNSFLQNK